MFSGGMGWFVPKLNCPQMPHTRSPAWSDALCLPGSGPRGIRTQKISQNDFRTASFPFSIRWNSLVRSAHGVRALVASQMGRDSVHLLRAQKLHDFVRQRWPADRTISPGKAEQRACTSDQEGSVRQPGQTAHDLEERMIAKQPIGHALAEPRVINGCAARRYRPLRAHLDLRERLH